MDAQAKLVVVANPDTPTGVLHARDTMRELLSRTPAVVVVDEAYADFAGCSVVDLVSEFPNLVVVRSFSKAYGLAGLRAGFGIARAETVTAMMKVKDVYNVSQPALLAACAALADRSWLRETVAKVVRTRTRLERGLAAMGLHVPPSRANFVFPRIPRGRAASVCEALEQRGILVRHFAHPAAVDSLRVTAGTDTDADAFLAALKEVL